MAGSATGKALAWAVGLGLLAGSVAIAANIAVLDGFDRVGIVTARGGLQKLARAWFADPLGRAGVGAAWAWMGMPDPGSAVFRGGFKVVVGLLMALVYTVVMEPWLRGPPLRRGLVAAIPLWCLNAFAVLPALRARSVQVACLNRSTCS